MQLETLLVIIIFLFIAITFLLGVVVVILYHKLKENEDFQNLLILYARERDKLHFGAEKTNSGAESPSSRDERGSGKNNGRSSGGIQTKLDL